jgi:DNA-binding transcriptional ArsR family regulator
MPKQSPALDRLFHALSDPGRRRMVVRLSTGPRTVSDLARQLPMSLPAAMQHLGVLEEAGLVRSQKIGRVRTCTLEPGALDRAGQWIADRRSEWEARLDRLGEYLETLKDEGVTHDEST